MSVKILYAYAVNVKLSIDIVNPGEENRCLDRKCLWKNTALFVVFDRSSFNLSPLNSVENCIGFESLDWGKAFSQLL